MKDPEKKIKKGFWAGVIAVIGLLGYLVLQLSGIPILLQIESCQKIEQKQENKNYHFGNEKQKSIEDSIRFMSAEDLDKIEEKQVKKNQKQESTRKLDYRNEYLYVEAHRIRKSGKGFLLDLTMENISDRELFLAFDGKIPCVYLSGDKEGIYYSDKEISNGATGLSHVNYTSIIYRRKFDRFSPGENSDMSILFLPKEEIFANDSVFTFNSKILCVMNGDVQKWSVGIRGIPLK